MSFERKQYVWRHNQAAGRIKGEIKRLKIIAREPSLTPETAQLINRAISLLEDTHKIAWEFRREPDGSIVRVNHE